MEIFKGSCVALVTPFKNKKVDFGALDKLLNFHIKEKTDAILVLGTTGEAACVSFKERRDVIKFARKKTIGKTKLIVGTGSNCTKTAIKFSKQAEELGADCVLIVTPYYNKCTQHGAMMHYTQISKSINIPIILYNVPSRTGFNLLPQTVKKLSNISNIIGIKEANSNIEHILELFKTCRDKIDIYSGNDNLNHIFATLGAKGTISVVANIFPKQIKKQFQQLSHAEAIKLADNLYDICNMCFVETNPIPVKYLLSKQELVQNELRLPLTPLGNQNCGPLLECYIKTKEVL